MPASSRFEGGEGSVQRVIALGTGAVSTGTHAIGVVPKNLKVKSVRFHGQGAVVATSLTGQVHARTTAGAAGTAMLTSAADVAFASAAAAKAGVAGTLDTDTRDARYLSEGQMLEAVVTADTCSQGPGDLVVQVDFEPRA